ncbi:Sir2 silent information regulator family NAD-dependent deacetylase [Pseudoflavonifractor sp. 524-17]|nr:Sir2 silent information regulator family NAD-dependent deacetylase [Pseudoflavonifractor sp. 524-17]
MRQMMGTPDQGEREQLDRLQRALGEAEAILIGGGAGLSASAGLTYSGARFERYFEDFKEKYGISGMYAGGFYPFESPEEYWAWWSRHIMVNRYKRAPRPVYDDLRRLVEGRDYFVLTTNVDHQFQLAGFDKGRLFYTQGDYGLWQCARPCHQKTYNNEKTVRAMAARQRDMKIPSELIPECPVCGGPMTMNLRSDDTFVQDEGWYQAQARYQDFLQRHRGTRVVFLELGVGGNTPAIIKYPFWKYTLENINSIYVCINQGQAFTHPEIASRSICIDGDIRQVIEKIGAAEKVPGSR